jgi:hypothetical protein
MRGDTFRPLGDDRLVSVPRRHCHGEASCFADEVAIDFPSVAPAVDRIRRGFQVEESSGRFMATILVSDQQARSGVAVPLDVPIRFNCGRCGGRGESWTEPCKSCDGSGIERLLQVVHVSVPPGVVDEDRFQFTVSLYRHAPTRVELRIRVR